MRIDRMIHKQSRFTGILLGILCCTPAVRLQPNTAGYGRLYSTKVEQPNHISLKRNSTWIIGCTIFLIMFLCHLSLNADSIRNEKQPILGLSVSNYTFIDKNNDSFYGANARVISLYVTFPRDNNYSSWRIALDRTSSSGDISGSGFNGNSDLSIGGFSGAFILHNSQKEQVRFYGGAGLGTYSAIEKGEVTVLGVPVKIDGSGSGIGVNLFGGISLALTNNFALGLECFTRSLKIDMSAAGKSDKKTNVDYSGNGFFLTFNFGF